MGKGVLYLISLLSMILSGCGRTGSEIRNQSVLPDPEPLPIAVNLEMEDLMIEDMTIEKLYDLNNGDVEIIYAPSTGIPRQINGIFSTEKISSEQDALKSLLSVRSIFQIPDDCSFTCLGFDDDRIDLQVYTLNQLYKGVLVDGGLFRIVTTKEGVPVSISGSYLQVGDVDENPVLSVQDGYKAIPFESYTPISSVSLIIRLTQDNESHLCWKYETFSKVYYVDAHNGILLDTISIVIY